MPFVAPAGGEGGRSHPLRVAVGCLAMALIAGVYLLFISPTFAAMISEMSIVPHLPQWLRRDMADTLVRRADNEGRYNAYKASSGDLEQAVRMYPADPGIWWRLCTSYETIKKWDLALGACQKEVQLKPDEISLGALGGVYMHRGEYSQAARVFERGSGPQNGYSPFVEALLASGQYQKAVSVAQLQIEFSEHEREDMRSWQLPDALRGLAFAYQQLGQKKKCQETLERLHDLDPTLHYHSCEMRPDFSISDVPIVQCF